MKRIFFILSFILLFGLIACSSNSISDYEEVLSEEGWNTSIIDPEEFDDENEPSGIVNILEAEAGMWEFGYVWEFDSSSNAQDFFEELKEEFDVSEDEVSFDDFLRHEGNFVYYSFEESFFDILDLN